MSIALLQEPFLSSEIAYRQERVREQFAAKPGRRHRVRRRHGLHLPFPRRRPVAVA
jgi:hypothetical protein